MKFLHNNTEHNLNKTVQFVGNLKKTVLQMNTGPKLADTPLELLTPDPNKIESVFSKYYTPVTIAVLAVVSCAGATWFVKRPLLSGIHRYFIAAGIGIGVGNIANDWKKDYLAQKDAMLRHYIQLHPEDFPPYERKKYSEVLLPWAPIR